MNTSIQILKPLRDKKIGDIISIDLQSEEASYWKRRLADSEIDGCCKIIDTLPKDEENQGMIQSEGKAKKNKDIKESEGE